MKEIPIVTLYYELYETAKSMIQLKNYENVDVVSNDLCSRKIFGYSMPFRKRREYSCYR